MTHWTYDEAFTPTDYQGFLYRITLSCGRYYIGKKFTFKMSKGAITGESDWAKYKGSSKAVKDLIKSDPGTVTYEILQFSESRGKCGYLEDRYLMLNDCLLDPLCLNGQIAMKYHKKVVMGWHNDARCQKYLDELVKLKKAAGLDC